jgi:hypothetical protein
MAVQTRSKYLPQTDRIVPNAEWGPHTLGLSRDIMEMSMQTFSTDLMMTTIQGVNTILRD